MYQFIYLTIILHNKLLRETVKKAGIDQRIVRLIKEI